MTASIAIVPFSHLDLFWAGTREECLSRGNGIIATALDLLDANEDFRFLIETVNFLEHYCMCYPDDEERIRRHAQSGRLELAPLWTGIFQQQPSGESLVRNILQAKRWVRARFGVDPDLAHFGDLPGYTPQFPQIAVQADIRHALLSRGGPSSSPLFRWQALDGSAIVAYYVVGGYAVLGTRSALCRDYATLCADSTAAHLAATAEREPHGGLMHWGCDLYAPNQHLVDNLRRWNEDGRQPIHFSTFKEFFARTPADETLPALGGELPSAWPNIESSWPDIWPADLPCEAALQMAEFLTVLCRHHGIVVDTRAELRSAWLLLLDAMDHNQNSQGGDGADADKLQLKQQARARAETLIQHLIWRLGARCAAADPLQVPLLVCNPLGWQRDAIVEAHVALYGADRSSDIGPWLDGVELIDAEGRSLPYVLLEQRDALSRSLHIAFRAADLPSAGYQILHLRPGSPPQGRTCLARELDSACEHDPENCFVFTPDHKVQIGPRRTRGADTYHTARYTISIDCITGAVDIAHRDSGAAIVSGMCIEGVEERRGNYISEMAPSGRTFPMHISACEVVDDNALWLRLRISGSIQDMPVSQLITCYADRPDIDIENSIDWQTGRWLRIEQCVPYAGDGDQIRYGVPFGQVAYPEVMPGDKVQDCDAVDQDLIERLRLVQHWVDIGDDQAGLCIACDHRMWEFDGRCLRGYMLRGIGHASALLRHPDGSLSSPARPPSGRYQARYRLRPRQSSLAASAAYRCGWELNRPPVATAVCGGRVGHDPLPARASLLDGSDSSAVVTAIKAAEDGDQVIIRAFEAAGTPTTMPAPSGIVQRCDLLEQASDETGLDLRPFQIATLRWNQ